MDGLKRQLGAKEVAQDDFAAGCGTYIASFDVLPKAKVAEVKAAVGKYKLEEVRLKFTTKAPEGNSVADLTLVNPKDEDLLKEVAALKGKKVLLSGVLTDGEKGRILTLSKVSEAK